MMRAKLAIGLMAGLLSLAGTLARPQNPLEGLGMAAMNLAGNIAEAVQSGAAINRDLSFSNPLMSVHSKTAIGYGDAMRPTSAGDSSEEDRRRKRSPGRSKRSPCFWKMTMTTASSSDDDVEARKKRAQKRAANNASRSRVSPKTKKLHRQRRQDQGSELSASGQQAAQDIGARIKGMWLSFVDNVTDVVKQMRQKISEAASSATT